MDEIKTVRPNYEAMYEDAIRQLEGARAKIEYLEIETQRKDKDRIFLEGFKNAVELIFGKGGCNA